LITMQARQRSSTGTTEPAPARAEIWWSRRAGVSLLGGILCTVVTACAGALLPYPQLNTASKQGAYSEFLSGDEPPAWHVVLVRAPWFTWVTQVLPPPGRVATAPLAAEEAVASLRQQVPAWARARVFRAPTPDDLNTGSWTGQVGLGWPFRSMYGRWAGQIGRPTGHVVQGLDLRPILGTPPLPGARNAGYTATSYVLPLRPIWPGFVYDAGIFALAVFVPWTGLVELRRRRTACRLARGLCPHCRYPLTNTDTCPECGRPLPLRETTRCRADLTPSDPATDTAPLPPRAPMPRDPPPPGPRSSATRV
jgi:hypothetical protein